MHALLLFFEIVSEGWRSARRLRWFSTNSVLLERTLLFVQIDPRNPLEPQKLVSKPHEPEPSFKRRGTTRCLWYERESERGGF